MTSSLLGSLKLFLFDLKRTFFHNNSNTPASYITTQDSITLWRTDIQLINMYRGYLFSYNTPFFGNIVIRGGCRGGLKKSLSRGNTQTWLEIRIRKRNNKNSATLLPIRINNEQLSRGTKLFPLYNVVNIIRTNEMYAAIIRMKFRVFCGILFFK